MFAQCRFCSRGTLDKKLTKGKIVLCDGRSKATGPLSAEAVGALIQGQTFRDLTPSLPLPGSYLDLQDGAFVFDYVNSTRYQLKMTFTITTSSRNRTFLK